MKRLVSPEASRLSFNKCWPPISAFDQSAAIESLRANNRVVAGTVDADGVKVVYLVDDGSAPTHDQFKRVSRRVDPPLLTHGGASEYGCLITTPDGRIFFSRGYHGDLEGWEKQITQGARELGMTSATIVNGVFKRDDRVQLALSECCIAFVCGMIVLR